MKKPNAKPVLAKGDPGLHNPPTAWQPKPKKPPTGGFFVVIPAKAGIHKTTYKTLLLRPSV